VSVGGTAVDPVRRPEPGAPVAPAPAPASPAPPVAPATPAVEDEWVIPSRPRLLLARLTASRAPMGGWWVLVVAGLAALVATTAGLVPEGSADPVGGVGAVAVASAYTWGLAARTGGRPYVFGGLAAALGAVVLLSDLAVLRTGAAVLTCVVSAIFAVTATVPAARSVTAIREAAVALVLAAVGAFAVVGFRPEVELGRFEYVTLAAALLGTFAVVYRLGAGFHGLGRRGLLVVLVGTVLLALVLAYAELLRRYGTPALVDNALDAVRWLRENAGAAPKALPSLLGVPALVWGTHMRARRRQGWWVCAFGVAATVRTAQGLVFPGSSLLEDGLSLLYSFVVGVLLGYLLIRVDLAFAGPRGGRARREEERAAVRPEPRRTRALL
jgi:hypothetical protein